MDVHCSHNLGYLKMRDAMVPLILSLLFNDAQAQVCHSRLPLFGPLEKVEVLNLPANYSYHCGYVSDSVDVGTAQPLCTTECEIDPLCNGKSIHSIFVNTCIEKLQYSPRVLLPLGT